MTRPGATDEQITGILERHDAGAKCAGLCLKHGMSVGTFHNRKDRFASIAVFQAKHRKALKDQHGKLKKLLAEPILDLAALKKPFLKRATIANA